MKSSNIIYLLGLIIIAFSCEQSISEQESASEDKVPSIKLFAQARPGGEAFEFDMPVNKGLDKLEFVDPVDVEIDSNELVIGIDIDDTQLAIPLYYLSGFEVANLSLNSNKYLITWCPLVGSARIFEGSLHGDKSGFDFGRGLMDNNLLIVDRKTNSVWNQLSCKSINGELEGNYLTPLPTIQSTWTFWKEKHPDTRLLINKDTSEAVFPSEVYQEQYYNTWEPGKEYSVANKVHEIDNLGLGVELDSSSIFFPFSSLYNEDSPLEYELEGQKLMVQFEKSGLTAWVENTEGEMIPSTIVYDWAWENFFPESKIFE